MKKEQETKLIWPTSNISKITVEQVLEAIEKYKEQKKDELRS